MVTRVPFTVRFEASFACMVSLELFFNVTPFSSKEIDVTNIFPEGVSAGIAVGVAETVGSKVAVASGVVVGFSVASATGVLFNPCLFLP